MIRDMAKCITLKRQFGRSLAGIARIAKHLKIAHAGLGAVEGHAPGGVVSFVVLMSHGGDAIASQVLGGAAPGAATTEGLNKG